MADYNSPGKSTEGVQDDIGQSLGHGLEYDDAGNIISATRQGPNPYDAAQTFTESSVSVTHNGTVVSGGSIKFDSGAVGTTATRGADESTHSTSRSEGLKINPNASGLVGVEVTLSSNTGPVQDVFLLDSNENILDEKTAEYSGGDTVTLNADLQSGTNYYVGVYNDGADQTVGLDGSPNYPYTSSDIDITDGTYGLHPDDNTSDRVTSIAAYAISDVSSITPTTSGSATLEWPYPTDLYEWDIATFTRTLDSETVDVFVAYSTDGGSTWTRTNSGNPISRNYSLADDPNISADSWVRFEVELSRQDTSNNPTFDSAFLSWFV
ncbi:hypothetical protein LPA44_04110 [Halobacterium sp. KA-4]|uniref:hypothetical protein n=1 Tax=Halobacterium sp. KA-4 TaxID=2896367 RepID=UPI001E28BC8E|nr:hypothetical protein [Halobacterium sp. KA-4]MCD2199083.1 hypothetical protein [Halobacterium sp. KA-4]